MADELLLQEIGKRVSLRRRELGLTQEQVAEKMDVSLQMISNLELGKKAIRPENLVKLCNVLHVSADFILTGKQSTSEMNAFYNKLSSLSPAKLKTISDLVDYLIDT